MTDSTRKAASLPALVVIGLALIASSIPLGDGIQVSQVLVALVGVALAGSAICLYESRQHRLLASLLETATRDPLTGLLNRRGFQEQMDIELARAARSGAEIAMVVLDIDDFKSVNDRLGHLGGDMALERVSGVIARTKRGGDVAVRLGGDEFAIILPDTGLLPGFSFAERLRAAVEQSFLGTAIGLSISVGVAGFPRSGRTAEELVNAADRAMYKAKELGKNRSAVHTPLEDRVEAGQELSAMPAG